MIEQVKDLCDISMLPGQVMKLVLNTISQELSNKKVGTLSFRGT